MTCYYKVSDVRGGRVFVFRAKEYFLGMLLADRQYFSGFKLQTKSNPAGSRPDLIVV